MPIANTLTVFFNRKSVVAFVGLANGRYRHTVTLHFKTTLASKWLATPPLAVRIH